MLNDKIGNRIATWLYYVRPWEVLDSIWIKIVSLVSNVGMWSLKVQNREASQFSLTSMYTLNRSGGRPSSGTTCYRVATAIWTRYMLLVRYLVEFKHLFKIHLKRAKSLSDSCKYKVLIGNKWVSNKWIHEVGQEFRRPCELAPV